MSLDSSFFLDCNINDFYNSLVYSLKKQDYYLDKMEANPIHSGKYIDAKVMYNEWENSYNAALKALKEKYPEESNKIQAMVNFNYELYLKEKELAY
jgi:hypothetical protein